MITEYVDASGQVSALAGVRAHPGETRIVDLVDRCETSVCGAVRSVSPEPRLNVPSLVVEIDDGSKIMNLVWLGRRRIGGVVQGTYLTAHGRVSYRQGVPTIFNPAYEIRPEREH